MNTTSWIVPVLSLTLVLVVFVSICLVLWFEPTMRMLYKCVLSLIPMVYLIPLIFWLATVLYVVFYFLYLIGVSAPSFVLFYDTKPVWFNILAIIYAVFGRLFNKIFLVLSFVLAGRLNIRKDNVFDYE